MLFVFLHIGSELSYPSMMVSSIKHLYPNSFIIQCTNSFLYKVNGIDSLFIHEGDIADMMLYRLDVFSKLALLKPAIYLDTDILLINKLDISVLLGNNDIAVCRRSFQKNSLINAKFKGMDLTEYQGKTMDEVYPYLASFTITKSYFFWQDCYITLKGMDSKFHYWYGDQEAMREVILSKKYTFAEIEEYNIACLPEYLNLHPNPFAIHFKGPNRKHLMNIFANKFL